MAPPWVCVADVRGLPRLGGPSLLLRRRALPITTSLTATSAVRTVPVSSTAWPLSGVSSMSTAAMGPMRRVLPYSGRSWRNQRHIRKTATGTATAAPAPNLPYLGVMSRVVDGDRQPGTDRCRGSKDEVVSITPQTMALRRLVSRSWTGRSKNPPHRIHDKKPADDQRDERVSASPDDSAAWTAPVAARIDSPSTISVSSP